MDLWLVRHGESTWNVLGLAQGQNDRATLTERGLYQADQVADELAAEARHRPITAVWTSDLRRALLTAAPVARRLGLPLRPDARLRERHLGVLEGGLSTGLVPPLTGIADGQVADPDAHPDGGESLRDMHVRLQSFVDDLPETPGDAVVVAHGGSVRVLLACLSGVPVERMSWGILTNASIHRITRPVAQAAQTRTAP
jgi:2,3-bisphosphoglycerate-dependent phosphoglycerate mutase